MVDKVEENYLIDFQDDLKFLMNSEIRLKILGYLYNSSGSIKEIEQGTGYNYNAIVDNINKLEEKKLIFNKENRFYLFNSTKLKLTNILYLNKSAIFLMENSNFLNNSHIDINLDTIKDLSSLEGSEFIQSDNVDLFRAPNIFQKSLKGFKFLKCISPYFKPLYDDIISYWIDNECTVDLILPKEVSEKVKILIREYVPQSQGIKNKYIKLNINDSNIKFALTVIDKCLVFGLYSKYGQFNQNEIITSTNQDAIDWGLKVFEECEKLCDENVLLDDVIYPEGRGNHY